MELLNTVVDKEFYDIFAVLMEHVRVADGISDFELQALLTKTLTHRRYDATAILLKHDIPIGKTEDLLSLAVYEQAINLNLLEAVVHRPDITIPATIELDLNKQEIEVPFSLWLLKHNLIELYDQCHKPTVEIDSRGNNYLHYAVMYIDYIISLLCA